MTNIAKLFKNGSSQAVRLPREYRFTADRVRVRRVGNGVLLEPYTADPEQWLSDLKHVPPDSEFLSERNQPRTPKREIFE
jgi:antitoxin VapB